MEGYARLAIPEKLIKLAVTSIAKKPIRRIERNPDLTVSLAEGLMNLTYMKSAKREIPSSIRVTPNNPLNFGAISV
jgi:hypothetical protein